MKEFTPCFVQDSTYAMREFLVGCGFVCGDAPMASGTLPYVMAYLDIDCNTVYFMNSVNPRGHFIMSGAIDCGTDVEMFKSICSAFFGGHL